MIQKRITLTEEERAMEERDSLELTAPGGFGAKLRSAAWSSQQVVIVIVIVACTGFLYFERTQSNRGFIDQHVITQKQNVTTQEMLGSVIKAQAQLTRETAESGEIQAYVLSLSQSQREKLNLSMPPVLRARIRQGAQ